MRKARPQRRGVLAENGGRDRTAFNQRNEWQCERRRAMCGGHEFATSIAGIIETTTKIDVGTVSRTAEYVRRLWASLHTDADNSNAQLSTKNQPSRL